MNNKEWKRWIFWFTFAVSAIIVYKTIDSVSTIFYAISGFLNLLMPFFLAILLAYILYMPEKKIEDKLNNSKFNLFKNHKRGISTFIIYLALILIIFILFNFLIPTVLNSIKDLIKNLPEYYNSRIEYFSNINDDSMLAKLNIKKYANNLKQTNIADNIMSELIKYINIDNMSSYIKGIISATTIIFDIFVTIIVSVYILLERTDIKSFLKNLSKAVFDEKTNNRISKYYKRTNSIFFTYITSQIIDAFIVGMISTIALSLLKVKYAVLLGFIIGLFNIIPYFGAIIGIIISIIITIITGGIFQALWMALIIIVLQQIDANIINPKILGSNLNLSPILIIFGVTIGGTYFGPLGMFLAVPIIAFIKLILEDFIETRNSVEDMEKENTNNL